MTEATAKRVVPLAEVAVSPKIVSGCSLVALLSLAFTSACSAPAASQDAGDDEVASSSEEALGSFLTRDLPGHYAAAPAAALDLHEGGSFELDTGIRCVTTPCPSGYEGTWSAFLNPFTFRRFVRLTSVEGQVSWYRVRRTAGEMHLDGLNVPSFEFVRSLEPETDACAAVRCRPGTTCQVQFDGAPACVSAPGVCNLACVRHKSCELDAVGKASCVFKCPAEKFVNCMPVIGPVPPEREGLCSGEYHEFMRANCPDVEFVY